MAEMLTLTPLAADQDRFHRIDLRDADDDAAAHVVVAVRFPLAALEARVGETPAAKTAVTICGKGGGRSAEGVDMLTKRGHPDALWLEGGTDGSRARNT